MKYILAMLFSTILFFSVCSAGENPDLKNKTARVSYSIGYQVGKDFNKQGVEINPEILLKGINDALAGQGPLLTHQEMRTTLSDLQKKVIARQEQEMKAQAEKNLADGTAYLAENAKKEGVTALPSGLQYRVIKDGSGKPPKADDTVTVHYRGTLIDGTEFDSSHSRGRPATFRADRVIEGWKEALQLMKEGAEWQLFIPPKLGYGNKRAGRIGPNSTLIFEVELISVKRAE